jgi:hypothetical protein
MTSRKNYLYRLFASALMIVSGCNSVNSARGITFDIANGQGQIHVLNQPACLAHIGWTTYDFIVPDSPLALNGQVKKTAELAEGIRVREVGVILEDRNAGLFHEENAMVRVGRIEDGSLSGHLVNLTNSYKFLLTP